MRRGILTVDFNTDVYDFQFPCCLKHRAPTEAAIFCGLKSQIRFYIKLTQVLPYNAGNLIFDNLRKKNTTGQGNEKPQRVERRHFE